MDFIKRFEASRQLLVVVSPANLTAKRILTIMGVDKRVMPCETLKQAIEASRKHVAAAREQNGHEGATA